MRKTIRNLMFMATMLVMISCNNDVNFENVKKLLPGKWLCEEILYIEDNHTEKMDDDVQMIWTFSKNGEYIASLYGDDIEEGQWTIQDSLLSIDVWGSEEVYIVKKISRKSLELLYKGESEEQTIYSFKRY